jgi:PAS domain S-box-containing protein
MDAHPGPEKRRVRAVKFAELDPIRRALQENEDWFQDLVEHSQDLLCIHDLEGRLLLVNPAPARVLGYSVEEILQIPMRELIAPEFRPQFDAYLRQIERNGESRGFLAVMTRSGERRIWEYHNTLRTESVESPIVRGIAHDVTEQKLAEKLAREASELNRQIIASASEGVVVYDRNLRCLAWNPSMEKLTGIPAGAALGRPYHELIPPELKAHDPGTQLKRALQGETILVPDEKISLPGGDSRWIATRKCPLRNADGEITGVMVTLRDITERTQSEESLRRNEESYRLFVSQSSEGIFREEMDAPVPIDLPEEKLVHRILYESYIAECNDALAAMYGAKSREELRGKRWREMAPPEDPQNVELTRQFVRSDFRVLDQESREVDIRGNPKVFLNSMIGIVENGMLACTWGIQRDITEQVKEQEARQKAEEALRQNVAQLQEVTEELRLAKEKLAEEKLYLEESIDSELGFGEIIGRSGALKEVMQKVAKVAPSDATVLLLGETGTGKELVARAIHRMSQREGKSFIKLNCAAIPSGLLESELFGHEKGAFTGAVARKLGRLELADKGTLFLDEIGEIPLNLQPKLLRVLQDMEFERLGGTQTLKVNFRLLAATNRDLQQSVKAHEFRSDLYYRLNVFPILVPPLRERREDIRPLVEHFVRKFAHQMKKSITSIPSKTMEMLVRWEWPGNIRELENFIERSVILSPGAVLQAPLSELEKAVDEGNGKNVTLRDKERERILQALRACKGKLGGPDGAAARLGLKRTTLQSKLDQLGIKPGLYRA